MFGNKKGGCGKSMTAVNLAGVIANAGHSVCVVDTDTNESIAKYIRRREKTNEEMITNGKEPLPFIKVEIRRPEDSLVRELTALKDMYDYVIIDTGGYENNAFKSSVGKCDVLYMPFQACQADLEQVLPTLKVITDTEEFINLNGQPDFRIDTRLMPTLVEGRAKDMLVEARNTAKGLLSKLSISSCIISYCKEVRKIQDRGITLADPVFTGGRGHPRRSMYELLFDEIKGTRSVMFNRATDANTKAA